MNRDALTAAGRRLLLRLGEGTEVIGRDNRTARKLVEMGLAQWLARPHPSAAFGYLSITAAGTARLSEISE